MTNWEEILRYAQNDKKREGWQRLPHSEARSNSEKRDPQGHAQKGTMNDELRIMNVNTYPAHCPLQRGTLTPYPLPLIALHFPFSIFHSPLAFLSTFAL